MATDLHTLITPLLDDVPDGGASVALDLAALRGLLLDAARLGYQAGAQDQPGWDLYTTREVADQLRLSIWHIADVSRARERDGHPIGRRVGRDWIYTAADVEALRVEVMRRGAGA